MEKIALDIRNLSVSYGKNTVLKNLDLAVPKNRITAIIGGSGCGKSTLLKAVNRTAEEYGAKVSGTVTLDGENAFSLPAEERGVGSWKRGSTGEATHLPETCRL